MVTVAGSGTANVIDNSSFSYSGSGSYDWVIDNQLTISGTITEHSGHTDDNADFHTISTLNGTTGGEWQTTGGGQHVYSTGSAFAYNGDGDYYSDVTTSTDNGDGYTTTTRNVVDRFLEHSGDTGSDRTWTSDYSYSTGSGMVLTSTSNEADSHNISSFTSENFSSSRTDWTDSNGSDGYTGNGYSWWENENNQHSYSNVTSTDRLTGFHDSSGSLVDISGTQRTDSSGDGYVESIGESHSWSTTTYNSGSGPETTVMSMDGSHDIRDDYDYDGFVLVTWSPSSEPNTGGSHRQ